MNTNKHETENGFTRITLIFANLKPESIRVNSRKSVALVIRVHPCPSVVEFFYMTLTEMRSLLTKRNIQLTRSLGQNFLHDGNQLRRIVASAEIQPTDKVLEIGPGLGPLTELLIEKAGEVLAIEMDARLVDFLCERFNLATQDKEDSALSPALSPEERGESFGHARKSDTLGSVPARERKSPSPGGEGRGEGGRIFRRHKFPGQFIPDPRRRARLHQTREARLERLEAGGKPAVFRRFADPGGTRRRPARTEDDRCHATTGSREAADGAGGRRRLRHSDAAGAD